MDTSENFTSMSGEAQTTFRDEAEAFTGALTGLPASAWARPTRCDPWCVRDLVGHVITVLARVPEMIASPAPGEPDTTATGYYRADHRFSETANADRVRTAQGRGAAVDAASLVHELAATAQAVIRACQQQPNGRVVRTRHGDAMLLSDFLTTRVVELAVHGIDVADALDMRPWLTGSAAQCLQQLLFGPGWPRAVATLGWDPVTLLRKTTGRTSVTPDESAGLVELGLRGLTFA